MPTKTLLDGRYEIGTEIASGGMAAVYRGVDHETGDQVAIKVLHPHLAKDESLAERLRLEAEAARKLHHPNTVAVHAGGRDGERQFIIMELLPGKTFQDEIDEAAKGVVSPERVREVAIAVLGALEEAHDHGVFHRDVKPSNVLLDEDGTPKLGDFGIAKVMDLNLTQPGDVLGTIGYMAPERLKGSPATVESDLYSVGVLLRHAVTGRLNGDVDSVAPELSRVVSTATDDDPACRYQSAAEMRSALQPGATLVMESVRPGDTTVMTADHVDTTDERWWTSRFTQWWLPVAVVVAFLAVVVLATAGTDGGGQEPVSPLPPELEEPIAALEEAVRQ